jgi:adenylate cyclase
MNRYIFFLLYSLFAFVFTFGKTSAIAQLRHKSIDSLENITKSNISDTQKLNTFIILSEMITNDENSPDTARGLSYAREGLKLAERSNWPKGVMKANMALGNIYYSCKEVFKAIDFYHSADSVARAIGDNENDAIALFSITLCYLSSSQYIKALDGCRQILALKPQPDFAAKVLGNMGLVYSTVGDYTQALIYYDSSLKITDDLAKTTRNNSSYLQQKGGLLITIGNIYVTMAQFDKSLANYNEARTIGEQTKSLLLTVMALRKIGKACELKQDYLNAIEYYSKALAASRDLKNLSGVAGAGILNELANVYLKSGNITGALEYANRSLKLAEENSYYGQLPLTYTTLGKIYTAQKKYPEAILYLKKAIAICGQNCVLSDEKDAWEVLGTTYEQMKEPALALAAFKHYFTIRDSVYNIEVAKKLTRIDLQSDFDRQSQAVALENKLKIQKQAMFTYAGFTGLVLVLLLSFFIYRNYSHEKKANIAISKANVVISDEKQRSEALLLNILPEDVAAELKHNGSVQAKLFDHVTVLFTDFVNFTEASERLTPEDLVAELHNCFMAFDQILGKYNIEKIKTVGDAYMAVSGLPHANPNHAVEIVNAALDFIEFMHDRKKKLGNKTFSMRIGIHSGTVVAGIVGVKKFAYDIWGDTVNTAARMEQYSEEDKINISQTTYELVKDKFTCTDRGEIDAKHKGKMRMYFVEG